MDGILGGVALWAHFDDHGWRGDLNLEIDPHKYGQYVFTIGGPGADSSLTWSSFEVPQQTDGPLPSTSGMPGGPFTCEQLAKSDVCEVAQGQCCTACASKDPRCSDAPLLVATAGAGTTGAGGGVFVNVLFTDNSTRTDDGLASGSPLSAASTAGLGDWIAGAGGSHAANQSPEGLPCQADCAAARGTAGMLVLSLVGANETVIHKDRVANVTPDV